MVKNIPDKKQCYIVSTQLYSEDFLKTQCVPIVAVFLPNQNQVTYEKMWEIIAEVYEEKVGGNFTPQKVHSDNELAFLNATRAKFPDVSVTTCLFHIFENFRKKGLFLLFV